LSSTVSSKVPQLQLARLPVQLVLGSSPSFFSARAASGVVHLRRRQVAWDQRLAHGQAGEGLVQVHLAAW
jgi:hypothetical protein